MNANRTAHADLLVENESGKLSDSTELTAAAGQHDATSGNLVEARSFESRAHELEGLFETRLHDADQDRARDRVGDARFLFADLRNLDDLALVGRRCETIPIEGLHAFGMGQRGREAARDVVGDMAATDRD